MGAGHGHVPGVGLANRVSPQTERTLVLAVLPILALIVVGLVILWPDGSGHQAELGTLQRDATVIEVSRCEGAGEECRRATVRIEEGPDAGTEVVVQAPAGAGAPELEPGDEVVLAEAPEAPIEGRYQLADFQRGTSLVVLALLFGIAVVALSGWRGVTALLGLALSVAVLGVFVLPALVDGKPPLAVALVGAGLIMCCSLVLIHGPGPRTWVALLGTLAALALTGVIGAAFTAASRFTGLADENGAYLGAVVGEVDLTGLLLAGLVIGSLGVLDDVTVTQTSAVWEIAAADPRAGRGALWRAAMRIGRDHVASTVNTLVLAYVGASLPLFLLVELSRSSALDVLKSEAVAQEFVRAFVGGLGIVAAVPFTTALAVWAVRPSRAPDAGALDEVETGAGGWTPHVPRRT